jgi:hypothetical protein
MEAWGQAHNATGKVSYAYLKTEKTFFDDFKTFLIYYFLRDTVPVPSKKSILFLSIPDLRSRSNNSNKRGKKNVIKLSKIWVWDPGSGKNIFRIPDSGSRGQIGTGSRIQSRNTGDGQ